MTRTPRTSLVLVLVAVTAIVSALAATVVRAPRAWAQSSYDSLVLADHPVAYWAASSGTVDLTGHGHTGSSVGGTAGTVSLPDGEAARTFDGVGQYVTVPSSSAFSIATTRALTWEAWIRPAVLQFPHSVGGYVDFMGKCASYSPTCEWESRMYDAVNSQNRPSRISAYAFNPSAGLGSAADWQPVSGLFAAGRWIHVVGEYQTTSTPSPCSPAYPGTLNIWVDGVKQNFAAHAPTGCMSQYSVLPRAGSSPLNIGTMARDSWFQGAIGKVAIYGSLLSQAQISAHFTAMTGLVPSGSCSSSCTLAVQPGSGSTTGTGTTTTTSSSTSATTSSGATATVKVTSTWSTGYCAAVTITTTGTATTSWSASASVVGRVTSAWDTVWSQSGSILTLRNVSSNGSLSAGSPVTDVGFCASTA